MKKMIMHVLPFMKKYGLITILGLTFGLLNSVLNVCIPKYVKELASIIEAGLADGIDMEILKSTGLRAIVMVVASMIFGIIQVSLMHKVSKSLSMDIRSKVNDKMNRISMSYYDVTSTGDILARVTDDITILAKFISDGLSNIVFSVVMIVFCIIMMTSINGILTLCVIGGTILGFFINGWFMSRNLEVSRKQRKTLGELNGEIEESLTGHLVIKSFNCESEVLEDFNSKNDELYTSLWKSKFYEVAMIPVASFTSNLSYVIVCIVGAALMLSGKADIAVIIAFVLYVTMFASPISQLSQSLGTMQGAVACSERVFDFLALDDIEDAGVQKPEKRAGKVVFDHVKFGYIKERTIVHDFSAVIEPGMKVAIVGPTGAGKSTIVNLLMRFYETNAGKIFIDDVEIHDISRQDLHDELVMVPQETWCFHGTIRENIVFSTENVTDTLLEEIIEKVNLSDLVNSLPDGLDTIISEQSAVSAGQKQLITIARAMLKDAPVLILDEATSSVDTRTERQIQQALDALTEGRTSFVIAHRLSTIRNADMIFVLKDGDIIETGNHDELIQKGGFYSELYYSQFDREA